MKDKKGQNQSRLEMALEALRLFLRSLPTNSRFSIISFGSTCEFLTLNGDTIFEYDDTQLKGVINLVNEFTANFGGTNLLEPLRLALDIFQSDDPLIRNLTRKVFLLTDGTVGNKGDLLI